MRINMLIQVINAIIGVLALMCILTLILSIQGCSSKESIKYEQVFVPTPQKCDFNITYEPQISTADLQSILKSVTDLSFDSKELRRLIKSTPCLDVNYIEKAN